MRPLPLKYFLFVILSLVFGAGSIAWAQKVVINRPEFGSYSALWRITHDAVVDDHANYHQHQCWSHDGRYLTYRHCPMVFNPQAGQPYAGNALPKVHVMDFFKDEDREVGSGIVMFPGASWVAAGPRWNAGYDRRRGASLQVVSRGRSSTTR